MTEEQSVFLEGGEEVDPDEEYQKLVEEASIEECVFSMPRGYLSVSQINTFRRCPRQYYFRYIKDLIRAPSATLVEGHAVHQSVAIGHLEALKHGKVPLDVMLDAHNDTWKKEARDIDWKNEINDESEEIILQRGRRFLEQYRTGYIPHLHPKVDQKGPFIERRFWVTVGDAKIPVLGYIDLVAKNERPEGSKEEEVIDHKVVGRSKSQSDVDGDFQLTVYSHATKIPRVRFQCFVRTKEPKIKSVAAIRTPHEWEWTKMAVQEVAKCISAGIFPPGNDGWHCTPKWCGFWDLCKGKGR